MAYTENISFNNCEEIKCIEAGVHIDDEGHMLTVPVYLYDVCPCRDVIVGVQVYVNGKAYAMKTRKVFTGGSRYYGRIHELFVDEFYFLFTDVCKEDVGIRILSHYIG